MDTLVLDRGHSSFLINQAHLVRDDADAADYAKATAGDWSIEKSNPFVQWIGGDFVEADNPNQNTQFWTASDLELSEYSIRHAPLNMVHQFRQPIGFFAATKVVKLQRAAADKADVAGDVVELSAPSEGQGSLKIQALSGLWGHIFPFEATQVEAANDEGLLFYSMECRGTQLSCETNEAKGLKGCGKTFDYMAADTHCDHLKARTSVRHIVSPTFRGGAVIVPPVRPGWKNAKANVLEAALLQEAASFAEQTEAAFEQLNSSGHHLSTSAWEHLMAQVVAASR